MHEDQIGLGGDSRGRAFSSTVARGYVEDVGSVAPTAGVRRRGIIAKSDVRIVRRQSRIDCFTGQHAAISEARWTIEVRSTALVPDREQACSAGWCAEI